MRSRGGVTIPQSDTKPPQAIRSWKAVNKEGNTGYREEVDVASQTKLMQPLLQACLSSPLGSILPGPKPPVSPPPGPLGSPLDPVHSCPDHSLLCHQDDYLHSCPIWAPPGPLRGPPGLGTSYWLCSFLQERPCSHSRSSPQLTAALLHRHLR